MSKPTEFPYQALGQQLRAARLRQKRTVAEASGAIEINEDTLKGIELGQQRPEEDTLMVLISYLGIDDDAADKMWDLAGYDNQDGPATQESGNTITTDINQAAASIMPGDLRVVYTDMVHVMVNDFGVIMNFLQGAGPNNQPLAVARIGMSKEHARSVIDILGKSLKQSEKASADARAAKHQPSPAPKTRTSQKPSTKTDKPASEK